ncbi:MAG: BTAD domain-containing putative transcriptional regulator [Acidimicrobiales bacterium]
MHSTIRRERLLSEMRKRHGATVIALESAPGFGRTVLLDHALGEGPADPRDHDLIYRCVLGDDAPGRLATRILDVCGAQVSPEQAERTVHESAQQIADALEAISANESQVALLIDDVDQSGDDGAALIESLVQRLGTRCHLVLSGRHLPRLGLPRLVANGKASLIGTEELAFRAEDLTQFAQEDLAPLFADPDLARWPALASLMLQRHADLMVAYIKETVIADLDPGVAKALAVLAAVGGLPNLLIEGVLRAAIGDPEGRENSTDIASDAAAVMVLPLVRTQDGCWPHPIWATATAELLSHLERDRAVLAKIRGLIDTVSTHDAGRQAIENRSSVGLAAVVRAALSTQPSRASVADLRTWAASGLLPKECIEQRWLEAVIAMQVGDPDGSGLRGLVQVRQELESAKDDDAEVSVLLQLGTFARANSDVAMLGFLLERAASLADDGNPVARVLVVLGEAVAAQLRGDPREALAALERIPPGLLRGEWASQALMMRGTNLLLAGRITEALVALHSSTGEGSRYTRSIAHDLLSAAKWYSGDTFGAIDEAEISEKLAFNSTTTWIGLQRRAWRACLLAATGQTQTAEELLSQLKAGGDEYRDEETNGLVRITEALIMCDHNELSKAREVLVETTVAPRATRAAMWKTSLEIALSGTEEDEAGRADGDPTLQLARAAGIDGARHLAGGPLVVSAHRPYLAARWCEPDPTFTTVKVIGSAKVMRNGSIVDHRAWGRSRVRELFLRLAIVENSTRALVAADMWPDLLDRDAGRNLRVTLTHLLDVLDPQRSRTSGSVLIVDTEGRLSLDRASGMRIDVWEHDRYANALIETPEHERETLLAHARRLAAFGWGPLLAGAPLGEWIEPHSRRRNELRISALLRGGNHAVAAADYRLAEELATAALEVDPWSQQAHHLLIESWIDAGDLDAARRAFAQAMEAFKELGVSPGFSVSGITQRLGIGFPR